MIKSQKTNQRPIQCKEQKNKTEQKLNCTSHKF